MKITHQFFRKYVANIAIVLALVLVGFLSYQGGVVGALVALARWMLFIQEILKTIQYH